MKIAPQFSIAPKNWLLPGRGDVVELGQRVGHAEIVVVVRQDGGRGVEREARLLAGARLGDDADLVAAGAAW